MKNNSNPFLPLFFALALVIGVLLGIKLSSGNSSFLEFNHNGVGVQKTAKVNEVINYILHDYVDSLNTDSFHDQAIEMILAGLDPHSAYIPAKNLSAVNEPLLGNFEGIGIEFIQINDTIMVASVIAGGPSENSGLKVGDALIKVNGVNIAGVGLESEKIISMLRGPSETVVNITVLSKPDKKPIVYKIKRGRVPLRSVEASFTLENKTGYIKLSRFASTTYDEFNSCLKSFVKQGVNKLIVDLRGNPGGYLDAAIKIADEFLPKGNLIVYTQGKSHPRQDYYATGNGSFESGKLFLLIDENSASASEILAGAIQENDRGTIIGRRSFGKGLVQEQNQFRDGSAVRLTVARYYTPSGRCIQKPFHRGNQNAYFEEEWKRYENGELLSKDSIRQDTSRLFKTRKGRSVYEGGGIVPDIFMPLDTTERRYFMELGFKRNYFSEFALLWYRSEFDELSQLNDYKKYASDFEISDNTLSDFNQYLKLNSEKISFNNQNKKDWLRKQIKYALSKFVFGYNAYYYCLSVSDSTIIKAINSPE